MQAIAHSPEFSKKAGVPQSVGKDFAAADKGKKFVRGGINKQNTRHGKMDMPFNKLNRFAGMKTGGIMENEQKNEDDDMTQVARDAIRVRKAKYYNPEKKKVVNIERGLGSVPAENRLEARNVDIEGLLGRVSPDERMKKGGMTKRFAQGGMMKESKAMVGKEVNFMKKKGAPKSMIKHEAAEMGAMKKGGMAKYARGGGIESRGKTKGTVIKMATGGVVGFAKGGGIEAKGKTKGTMIKMKGC
jgi:hypothetical protein